MKNSTPKIVPSSYWCDGYWCYCNGHNDCYYLMWESGWCDTQGYKDCAYNPDGTTSHCICQQITMV